MEKMNAAVLHKAGDIRYEKVNIPEIDDDDVLIKVAYCGVCGSDLPRTQKENGARMYPLIIGHEFSGIVEKIGKNVSNIKLGQKVAVAPLVPNWDNLLSKEGYYGISDDAYIIGTGSNGAMAEYVKVPKENVIALAGNIGLLDAAGLEPAAIGFHACRRADIKVGDTVMVLGCGSIGQFTIQCAKIFGAKKVIAVDIFDEKLDLAEELGADITINSKKEDIFKRVMEETDGFGPQVILETAGSHFTQTQSIQLVKKHGTVVLVGLSHAPLSLDATTLERILRAEITLKGSWNSYTAPFPGRDWEGVLHFMENGQIKFKKMISHEITLEELNNYLHGMSTKDIPFNKVVVKVEGE